MRLDKYLAAAAGLSRSQARETIRAGRVTVDGRPQRNADMKPGEGAAVLLDGKALFLRTALHLMLNKPAGILTAARDSRERTVMDLLPESALSSQCMPVGRLDKDSEGLLLLTTDGELAHRLLSPRRGIQKTYEARVEGELDREDVAAFQAGIRLSDFTALPAKLQILRAGTETSLGLVTIHEGKHRQVRRMFGSLGHEVISLKRTSFGPLPLDPSLNPGQHRELREEEVALLREAVRLV